MISIQDVTFIYPGGVNPALRGLNLQVPQGAFFALIGNNGSGKTSLCKLLNGIIPHFFEGEFLGSVQINGMNIMDHSISELSRHVGYVYQDFENQLLKPKVIDDVAFSLINYGIPDYKNKAQQVLELLGISHLSNRIIWELSGGEQHLVALAGALAMEPGIIVVDEPASQLDPVNTERIYEALKMLHSEHGKTIIAIEHHPDLIGKYCQTVVLVKDGSVVWELPATEALCRVEELEQNEMVAPQVTQVAYQVLKLSGKSNGRLPINVESADLFFRENPVPKQKGSSGVQETGSLDQKVPHDPLIQFTDVSVTYQLIDESIRNVLEKINFSIYSGERIALVGANGAGKSTILRLVSGLEIPAKGHVEIIGMDTKVNTPEKLADHVAFVYQNPQLMFIEDNVQDDIALYPRSRNFDKYQELVERAMDDFQLRVLADRDGRLLSGGQMRRVSLAIGACMRPKILLLDEPTSNLDVSNRRQILAMLEKLDNWVKTVVVASHDMELVAEWASRVIVLRNGSILADCSPVELFSDPQLIQRSHIRPPQVVEISNRLGISPVHLTTASIISQYMEAFK